MNRLDIILEEELDRALRVNANRTEEIPAEAGYYMILCNKPVPGRERVNKIGESYFWFDSANQNMRSSVKNQLHNTDKFSGTSGNISVEVIEFDGDSRFGDQAYYEKVLDMDPSTHRYRNGININDGKYEGYVFEIVFIQNKRYRGAIKDISRELNGSPIISKYKSR